MQKAHPLTAAQVSEFRGLLADRRADIEGQVRQLEGSLSVVQDARSSAADADDEHDPEGPTVSAEWSRIAGSRTVLDDELAAIDAAESRLDAGTYGTCVRCGGHIAVARLRARPEAELCIDCARLTGA